MSEGNFSDTQFQWTLRRGRSGHFRRFLLRGLAVVLPPILTIVILVWVGGTVHQYVIKPVHQWVEYLIAYSIMDARDGRDLQIPPTELPVLPPWKRGYRLTPGLADQLRDSPVLVSDLQRLSEILTQRDHAEAELYARDYGTQIYVPVADRFIPFAVYHRVAVRQDPETVAKKPLEVYRQYVSHLDLGTPVLSLTSMVSVVVLVGLVVVVYFLGRFLAAGLGRALWQLLEYRMIFRLPLVRSVYSSVKQVTDFVLTERQVQYNRVVAVEYPRRGVWSIGFVTGESMRTIAEAAGQPIVSVLIPNSPLPMTGYTINLPKSEVLDLNITVDQAFQFCVSCGVVVPPSQLPRGKELAPKVPALEAATKGSAAETTT